MHNPVMKDASGDVLFDNTTRFRSKNATRFSVINVSGVEEQRRKRRCWRDKNSSMDYGEIILFWFNGHHFIRCFPCLATLNLCLMSHFEKISGRIIIKAY